MGIFSNLIMYLSPAMSRAIDPRTEATKVASSTGGINGLCHNAHNWD
jgi:hypothetical protein